MKSAKPRLCHIECYSLEDRIYVLFAEGARLTLDSYLAYGDKRVYTDEKLVRIYYVHTIQKASSLCDIVEQLGGDYSDTANSVANFIKAWPCLWHYLHDYKKRVTENIL